MIATREEIIQALQEALEETEPCETAVAVPIAFLRDVLELLQPTARRLTPEEVIEPARVMTLYEIENANGYVWREDKHKGVMSVILIKDRVWYEKYLRPRPISGTDFSGWHLHQWRCWTAQPTDEQRKAAKWDE